MKSYLSVLSNRCHAEPAVILGLCKAAFAEGMKGYSELFVAAVTQMHGGRIGTVMSKMLEP